MSVKVKHMIDGDKVMRYVNDVCGGCKVPAFLFPVFCKRKRCKVIRIRDAVKFTEMETRYVRDGCLMRDPLGDYTCSECGYFIWHTGTVEYDDLNYCPKCGVKFDHVEDVE